MPEKQEFICKPKGQCDCLICPLCGAHELTDESHGKPVGAWRFNIRAFRVDNASHCLACGKWFE